jgi:hypothetical protein
MALGGAGSLFTETDKSWNLGFPFRGNMGLMARLRMVRSESLLRPQAKRQTMAARD